MLCSFNTDICITVFDLSVAFDTTDKNALVNILKDLLTENDPRIIHYLLSETIINVKIHGNATN